MKAVAASLRAITRSFWGCLALHALWLHGLWEVAQCSIFYDMSDISTFVGIVLMVGATLADVVLTVFLVWITLRLNRRNVGSLLRIGIYLIALGAVAAFGIEAGAQAAGWWRYSAIMPVIPIFEWQIGMVPLLQMALLPGACFLLVPHRLR